jgi:integrase
MEAKSHRISQKYTADLMKIMEADVFPLIGQIGCATVTTEQLVSALLLVEERHGTEFAHRICSLCREVFANGIIAGIREWNPAIFALGALSPRIRNRSPVKLTLDKLKSVVTMVGGYSGSPVIGAALRQSLLLLVRPGELCRAEWKDVDLGYALWRYELPVRDAARGRRESHEVPLSTQSVCIFQSLQPITGGGRYIFPDPHCPERPVSPDALPRALRKMGLARDATSSDAFRASARALLRDVFDIPPEIVDRQIGHAVEGAMRRAGWWLLERREMMQMWSDWIERVTILGEIPALYLPRGLPR